MDSPPTKITAIEESRGEFLVSVSGLPERLALPVSLIHQYHLKPGVVLTSAQVNQLVNESERYLCEREVARLLALREHTTGELRLKLKRKGFAERTIAVLIEKFAAQRLLDDARLAMNLAHQALMRKPCGRAFLVAVLRKKMIERSLAERTVDQVLQEIDPTAEAVRALAQKWPSLDQIQVESVRSKAYSYLSRRGFDYQTARAACNEVFGTTGKAEED